MTAFLLIATPILKQSSIFPANMDSYDTAGMKKTEDTRSLDPTPNPTDSPLAASELLRRGVSGHSFSHTSIPYTYVPGFRNLDSKNSPSLYSSMNLFLLFTCPCNEVAWMCRQKCAVLTCNLAKAKISRAFTADCKESFATLSQPLAIWC